ncbi:MAG: glycosyltransferase family 4 protein [Paludibacteraceae bacterium]|nr:glycosyltransferase family 4 protein [Paludibacteraceae bacterium]
MKTIGYVCFSDPFNDKKAWSGSNLKLREGLENAGYQVKWIPMNFSLPYKIWFKIVRFFEKGFVPVMQSTVGTWFFAKSIKKKDLEGCDYYFFPGHSHVLRFVDVKKPIIYYTDCTFPLMIDYYWNIQAKWLEEQGIKNDRIGHEKSDLVIKSSDWAAQSAIKDFGIPEDRVKVIEFGCSIPNDKIVETSAYQGGELRIVFSGVEWDRKGTDVAIDTVKELRNKGYDARLFLCGIKMENIPAEYRDLPYVEYAGFMDKNIPEQEQKYINIWQNGHIFLLPTKAECSGIVFTEASAYGLPVFTYDTGGIGNYVKNGINGYRLKMGSSASDFADAIDKSIKSGELPKMKEGGKTLYRTVFNWNVWAEKFKAIMQERYGDK